MIDTAVIMAAGLGSRLGKHSQLKPKGFLILNDLPIIERSINILLNNGIKKIIIGTGHLANHYENLKKKYPQIICVRNDIYALTSSFFTLYNLKREVNKDFLLLESDLLYEARAVISLLENNKYDVVLASGKTNSGDEVYIEADENNYLLNMSKNKSLLKSIYGELVGISKISFKTFKSIVEWAEQNKDKIQKLDYESVLVKISNTITKIYIEKIESLLWCEIDDENHLLRAKNVIYPKIMEIENV